MAEDRVQNEQRSERQAFLAAVAEAAHEWTVEHPEWRGLESDTSQSRSEAERGVHVSIEAEAAFVAAIERRGWRSGPGGNGWSRAADGSGFSGFGEAPGVDHGEIDDV